MSKNLSQEFCKICNIETPGKLKFYKRGWDEKQAHISAGRGLKEFDFLSQPYVHINIIPTNQWDDRMGFVYPYTEIENIKKIYDSKGYSFVEFQTESIDFEKATNFVKLLEIVTRHSSISFLHNGAYYGCDVHYFINHIFEAVEGTLANTLLNSLMVSELRNGCKPTLLERCAEELRNCKWD